MTTVCFLSPITFLNGGVSHLQFLTDTSMTVAELRKEQARGGLRKEIIQSDDEEEAKKVSPTSCHM